MAKCHDRGACNVAETQGTEPRLCGARPWCHHSRVLRTLSAIALAASSCSDCVGPELTPLPEIGGASAAGVAGSVGASGGGAADGCYAGALASDYGDLTIDFETMMARGDRFDLGTMSTGIAASGIVSSSSPVFIRQGHSELSQRSLLLLLDEPAVDSVDLRWGVCLDATTRSGITFWAKGEASTASVYPMFAGAHADLECATPVATIALTAEWQMFSYEWIDFCPNSSASLTFPSKLAGLSFSIQGTAAAPWLALDDVSLSRGGD